MEALRSQTSWRDFKALMSRYFARDEEPLYNKVVLLQSLFKSPEENCHHYLIRYVVRHQWGFFLGFFRRFRRLTRRNSELDECFAELDKIFDELG